MKVYFEKLFGWLQGFSAKDRIIFCKRLSFMVGAGVPILQSLKLLSKQAKANKQKKVFGGILKDVSGGHYLHLAIKKHLPELGEYGINIIKVGELSGKLGQNLNYLSEDLKKKHELQRKVLGAMFYPAFIVVSTFFMVIVLTVFIFPKVLPIFTSLNMPLPLSTKILIFVSQLILTHGVWVFLFLFISALTFYATYKKNVRFERLVERCFFSFPVVGRINKLYFISQISRTLGVLLEAGMRLDEAVLICASTTRSLLYKKSLKSLYDYVLRGGKVSGYLATENKLFGESVADMVAVGEASGNLSATFLYVSNMYEAELEDLAKNLSSALEPFLIVLMGFMVGFVAVSIITPIYSITQKLKP